MIKALVFDLSEVLLQGLLGTEKYINKKYGLRVTKDDWLINEFELLLHGKITEEKYFQTLINKYNWKVTVDQLKKAVRINFKEIKGTRQIIETLKNNGYRLGLLSVHAKEWIEYCEKKYGYHRLFDSILYSFEGTAVKPDRKAYELILNKLKVKPSECVFIDDNIKNATAAERLGIKTVQFKNHVKLRSDLKNLGLRIDYR